MENIFQTAEKLGFKTENDPVSERVHFAVKRIIFNNIPIEEMLNMLLRSVSSKYYFSFFDYFHKQISDPGA